MKRAEIEERIEAVLYECTSISGRLTAKPAKDILTDLFIELSNESVEAFKLSVVNDLQSNKISISKAPVSEYRDGFLKSLSNAIAIVKETNSIN